MSKIIRAYYDELQSILKKLNGDTEDVAVLHSTTIQRVNALRKEWVGGAADRFFNEMDWQLIPALSRLINALVFTQDVLNRIMKIYYETDEENASLFENSEWGEGFGAGMFGSALAAAQAGSGTVIVSGVSGNRLPEEPIDGGSPGSGTGSFGGFSTGSGSPLPPPLEVKTDDLQPAEEVPIADSAVTAGGGGGGGSSSSGLQGDLKSLGESLGVTPANSAFVGGSLGGLGSVPDHNFDSGIGGSGGADQSGGSADSASSGGTNQGDGGQPSTSDVFGAAAGAAVIAAGAAAAKIVKDKNE